MATWDGDFDSDFLIALNWAGNVSPGSSDIVTINSGGFANQPILNFATAASVDTVNLSSGSLTLNGSITATNGVKVTGGLLQLGSNGSVDGSVSVSGTGSYSLNGTQNGNLFMTGGSTSVVAGAALFGSVTMAGGQITVSGVHNFNDLIVSGGSLVLENAFLSVDSLSGTGGQVNLSATVGDTRLEFGSDGTSANFSGDIVIGSSTGLTKVGSGSSGISGAISGLGKVSVNSGTLGLSGLNTYSGNTEVAGTTLALSGNGSIANSNVVMSSSALLDISGATTGTAIRSLSINGSGNIVEMGGKALNIVAQASSLANLTFDGANGSDALSITLAMSTLHLSFLNFTNWTTATDTITVIGNSSSNILSESAYRDHLQGGGGNDQITILGQFANVAGQIFDGGADSDELVFDGPFSDPMKYNLRDDTLVSLETLTIGGGARKTVLLNASQFGAGIALDAFVGIGGTNNSTKTFDIAMKTETSLNLSGLTWGAGTEVVRFVIRGDGNSETVRGTTRNDTMLGAGGADALSGDEGKDILRGGSGNDVLAGGLGDDTLRGDANSDELNGGHGKDVLTGGTSSDSFLFLTGDSGQTANSADKIVDYTKGALNIGDSIDFETDLSVGGSAAAASNGRASINATTGVATFAPGSGDTFSDAINDITRRLTASGDNAGEFALFRVGGTGDYFLFISDGKADVGSNDVIVLLQNITSIGNIDISNGDITILT